MMVRFPMAIYFVIRGKPLIWWTTRSQIYGHQMATICFNSQQVYTRNRFQYMFGYTKCYKMYRHPCNYYLFIYIKGWDGAQGEVLCAVCGLVRLVASVISEGLVVLSMNCSFLQFLLDKSHIRERIAMKLILFHRVLSLIKWYWY